MSNITIVGAGMMGSALAFPARENGHRVRLTGTHLDKEIIAESKRSGKHPKFDKPFPEGVEYFYFEELEKALEGADMVICGVNSFGVDWFMEQVLPHIPDQTPVLSVTKGLIAYDDGTLISYPEYWERNIAPRKMNLNAVGGPCTSYELVAHDQTIVSFCGREMKTLELLPSGYLAAPVSSVAVHGLLPHPSLHRSDGRRECRSAQERLCLGRGAGRRSQ